MNEPSPIVSVTVLHTKDLTLAYLSEFLNRNGNPDRVIVSPQDFRRLLSLLGNVKHEQDYMWLLGVQWKRGLGSVTELDWTTHELRSLERT